jgi:glycerol-3-phosphate acyltransferase PlsX
MSIRIAIDAMGGDAGLPVTLPAALSFLGRNPSAAVVLVGDQAAIEAGLRGSHPSEAMRERIEIRHASEVVGMDESPASALRSRRDSSMRVAVDLVRTAEAAAAVSAGNTGALMAISRFVLKMLEGIDRPAIATQLPNRHGGATTMLDLGANVDCEPRHYFEFALMGSALVSALGGSQRPSVGLLNIGEEIIKGNETVRQAAELLRASALNFIGNVEGNDIFEGKAEVVVCDGFVGNVALKTSEGLARMLGEMIREEFTRDLKSRLAGLIARPVLSRFKQRVDPRRYNGASLIGLRGVVFKSHGSTDALGFDNALQRAFDAASNRLNERIAVAIGQYGGATGMPERTGMGSAA